MKITLTDAAIAQLQPLLEDGKTLVKLVFDTEGCGCSVNGVPTLWLVHETAQGEIQAESEPFPLIYKAKDEIFFEDQMKLDYENAAKSYILKSNNQIYNAHMALVDKR